jgi:hypothetical protein
MSRYVQVVGEYDVSETRNGISKVCIIQKPLPISYPGNYLFANMVLLHI